MVWPTLGSRTAKEQEQQVEINQDHFCKTKTNIAHAEVASRRFENNTESILLQSASRSRVEVTGQRSGSL